MWLAGTDNERSIRRFSRTLLRGERAKRQSRENADLDSRFALPCLSQRRPHRAPPCLQLASGTPADATFKYIPRIQRATFFTPTCVWQMTQRRGKIWSLYVLSFAQSLGNIAISAREIAAIWISFVRKVFQRCKMLVRWTRSSREYVRSRDASSNFSDFRLQFHGIPYTRI